jgi:alanyl-tRNA synthetase
MNGRGGGRADVAQAGGNDASLLGKALEAAPDVVREALASSEG